MNTKQNHMAAIAYILTASAIFAAISLLAKMLGQDTLGPALHPMQISHGRFLFAFLALIMAATYLRPQFKNIHYKLHIGRSFCGWAGATLLFAAVAFIPLTDATAISFLNPVFAMMLAIPLLGERVGRVRWSAAVLALIGALVLLRPTPDSFQPAAMLALFAAIMMGVEANLIKMLTRRENPLQILLVNNAIGLVIASVPLFFIWQTPTATQWAALATLGAIMAVGQAFFIQALRRADASFVVPFAYSTLIFATFYDYIVFSAIPDTTSIIGGTIIIIGAVTLAWRETRLR